MFEKQGINFKKGVLSKNIDTFQFWKEDMRGLFLQYSFFYLSMFPSKYSKLKVAT